MNNKISWLKICDSRKGVKEICPDNKSRFAPRILWQLQFIKNDYWKKERQTDYVLIVEPNSIEMAFGVLSAIQSIMRKTTLTENGT